ncbi:MAG: hypothetical protein D6786_04105 [Gammaproteobacteria bacterium]|nr:MAG: hypothetical protein D6786_04105 [Gammaproteobacteria bacterium]
MANRPAVITLATLLATAPVALAAEKEGAPVEDLATLRIKALEQRLSKVERLVQSQGLLELMERVDRLQAEQQRLQGEIERLNHILEQQGKRQRELYLDLDGRLQRIESGAAARGPGAASPSLRRPVRLRRRLLPAAGRPRTRRRRNSPIAKPSPCSRQGATKRPSLPSVSSSPATRGGNMRTTPSTGLPRPTSSSTSTRRPWTSSTGWCVNIPRVPRSRTPCSRSASASTSWARPRRPGPSWSRCGTSMSAARSRARRASVWRRSPPDSPDPG